jgi:hypothetical protein
MHGVTQRELSRCFTRLSLLSCPKSTGTCFSASPEGSFHPLCEIALLCLHIVFQAAAIKVSNSATSVASLIDTSGFGQRAISIDRYHIHNFRTIEPVEPPHYCTARMSSGWLSYPAEIDAEFNVGVAIENGIDNSEFCLDSE